MTAPPDCQIADRRDKTQINGSTHGLVGQVGLHALLLLLVQHAVAVHVVLGEHGLDLAVSVATAGGGKI